MRGATLRLKRLLRLLLPGIVPEMIGWARPAERLYFGPAWPRNLAQGWDDATTEAAMRRNWPLIANGIEGTAALAMLPYKADEPDLTAHNMLFTSLYVLARAAHRVDRLSVLDWGGSLGHYALVARRLLPEVTFDYLVKEMETNRRLAAELNPNVTFVSTDDACFARTYDVVMANGSMHYVEDWKATASKLAAAASPWLLINCQPIVRRVPSYVVVQRLRSQGYRGDFYSHVLNRDELVEHISGCGFALEREVMSWGIVPYKGAPEDTTGAGFLFKRL